MKKMIGLFSAVALTVPLLGGCPGTVSQPYQNMDPVKGPAPGMGGGNGVAPPCTTGINCGTTGTTGTTGTSGTTGTTGTTGTHK